MADPTISVVIPTHDRLPLLPRAIASAFAQTVPVSEVIAVDDGSTDGTARFLAELGDARVRHIRLASSHGAAHARNVGIEASRSRFVAFLDSDDEWMPTYIERMLTVIDRTPGAIAVCSSQVIRRPSREDLVAGPDWQANDAFERLLSSRSQICIAIVAERSVLENVRFDETLPAMQDRDFVMALCRQGTVACAPDALYVAHSDAGSRISDPSTQARARLMLIEKYRSDLEQRPQALAHNYYRLARLYRQAHDRQGVRDALRRASRADESDRRLRVLAAIAGLGPTAATMGLSGLSRISLVKRSVHSRLVHRAGLVEREAADA